jgi:hypothetical protein
VFLGRDSQRRFEEVGKLAIAENLILKENHGALFHNRDIKDDWYAYLFNTLTAGIKELKECIIASHVDAKERENESRDRPKKAVLGLSGFIGLRPSIEGLVRLRVPSEHHV